jgi:hypothetical protein
MTSKSRMSDQRLTDKFPNAKPVFFIQNEGTGHIKIGEGSDPWARLQSMQTGNSYKLNLLKTTSEYSESDLHKRFAPYHLEGEWFEASPVLLEFIDTIPSPEEAREAREVSPRNPIAAHNLRRPPGRCRPPRPEYPPDECVVCSRPRDEVRMLIAGPGIYICDGCVWFCAEIPEENGIERPPTRLRPPCPPERPKEAVQNVQEGPSREIRCRT